jgi:elongation factor Ts
MDYFNHYIESYVHNGGIGVLIELDVSDTFAFRADVFKVLANDLAMQVAAMNPDDIEDLLSQPFVKDPERTVDQRISQVAEELKSKMVVRRFVRWVRSHRNLALRSHQKHPRLFMTFGRPDEGP